MIFIEMIPIIFVFLVPIAVIVMAVILVKALIRVYEENKTIKIEHNQILHKIHEELEKLNNK